MIIKGIRKLSVQIGSNPMDTEDRMWVDFSETIAAKEYSWWFSDVPLDNQGAAWTEISLLNYLRNRLTPAVIQEIKKTVPAYIPDKTTSEEYLYLINGGLAAFDNKDLLIASLKELVNLTSLSWLEFVEKVKARLRE